MIVSGQHGYRVDKGAYDCDPGVQSRDRYRFEARIWLWWRVSAIVAQQVFHSAED